MLSNFNCALGGLLVSTLLAIAPTARAQSPFRFDDNVSAYASPDARVGLFDQLKYIPLGDDARDYLSFGFDLRERIEVNSNALLGYRNRIGNLYDLHRSLVFADVQYGDVRGFVQIGNETEAGREPGPLPTDIDRGDLAQSFLDYTVSAGDNRLD